MEMDEVVIKCGEESIKIVITSNSKIERSSKIIFAKILQIYSQNMKKIYY